LKVVIDGLVRLAEARRDAGPGLSPAGLAQRLDRLETAVDTIAVELERMGEVQRFLAQLPRAEAPPPRAPDLAVRVRAVTPD
jgi:hypothetical protein